MNEDFVKFIYKEGEQKEKDKAGDLSPGLFDGRLLFHAVARQAGTQANGAGV